MKIINEQRSLKNTAKLKKIQNYGFCRTDLLSFRSKFDNFCSFSTSVT